MTWLEVWLLVAVLVWDAAASVLLIWTLWPGDDD